MNMGLNEANSGYSSVKPVWEVLDLAINGSGAGGVLVQPTKSVYLWTRCIWHMEFDDDAIQWDVFAGESSALTNGIQMQFYGENALDDPIVVNADFFKYGYDVNTQADTRSPKANILSGRWTFSKSTPRGVVERSSAGHDIGFLIQDDMRPATLTTVSTLQVTLQGWQFV
jgi:hypothetical protein